KAADLAAVAEKEPREADEGLAGCPWEDDSPIVDWDTDSYPFVCVTMLRDCSTMIGGETALRTGGGDILQDGGAAMVCLQRTSLENESEDWSVHRGALLSFKVDTLSIKPCVSWAQQSASPW